MSHETEDPQGLEDTMIAWVLGELDAAQARDFERRLAADPALARETQALRATLALVPYASVQTPPPALRARVLAAAGAGAAAAPLASAPRSRAALRPAWTNLLAAAAALAAVAFGLDAWRTREQLAALQLASAVTAVLQEPNVVARFALAGTAAARGAVGGVVLDLDAQRGAVIFDGLPPLPDGQVYRLWAAVGDKDVPCGDFRPRSAGDVVAQFAVPVDAYDAPIDRLFVTAEPKDATGGPTGAELLRSV